MADYRYARSPGRWDSRSMSLALGSVFGILVRVHISLLVFAVYRLTSGRTNLWFEAAGLGILFTLVLLHEFGHCFACRFVRGRADDILLWPLGGLAYCQPPHRPLESLITTLGGPSVNLLIFCLLLPVLFVQGGLSASVLNPFADLDAGPGLALYTHLCFRVNYLLLLFNLCLPIFPFDGGRVVQEVLWFKLGYYHATVIATSVGLIGSFAVFCLGIYLAGAWNGEYLLLACVGFFGFASCYRVRQELEQQGQMMENEFGYDFSEGYTSLEQSTGRSGSKLRLPSLTGAVRLWLRQRRERQEARVEIELDRILAKISATGIDSLTRAEKRILQMASRRRRR